MSLKLNCGLSKKIGQPDFGSLGASCSVEVELSHDLVFSDLETFQRHVRNAYVACAQAVNDELSRHQQVPNAATSNGHGANGNGHTAPNGNGKPRSNARRATASQVRALHAIANRQGFDLAETLQEFGTRRPEDLSIIEASQLIDTLKAAGSHTS
jgi:hypothetical protein